MEDREATSDNDMRILSLLEMNSDQMTLMEIQDRLSMIGWVKDRKAKMDEYFDNKMSKEEKGGNTNNVQNAYLELSDIFDMGSSILAGLMEFARDVEVIALEDVAEEMMEEYDGFLDMFSSNIEEVKEMADIFMESTMRDEDAKEYDFMESTTVKSIVNRCLKDSIASKFNINISLIRKTMMRMRNDDLLTSMINTWIFVCMKNEFEAERKVLTNDMFEMVCAKVDMMISNEVGKKRMKTVHTVDMNMDKLAKVMTVAMPDTTTVRVDLEELLDDLVPVHAPGPLSSSWRRD
jgi:hypothetical protein